MPADYRWAVSAAPDLGGGLTIGDTVVEVDDDFHEATLTRLLRVVAAC